MDERYNIKQTIKTSQSGICQGILVIHCKWSWDENEPSPLGNVCAVSFSPFFLNVFSCDDHDNFV